MADTPVNSITITLRLSKALGLSRQGRLREAQQLLAADGILPENAIELQALAALATGEGDYTRAQRLWRLLLQREPGHAQAKRMIDSIELWLSRPVWFQFIPIGLGVAGMGLVVVVLLWLLGGEPTPRPRVPVARSAVVAPVYQPSAPPPPSIFLPSSKPTESRRLRDH